MCVLLLSNKGLNIYGVSFFHFGRQEAQSKKMVTQLVKNLPAMRDTWIQSLGWEDPLGKGMPTYSSILAWRIPWPEPWQATAHGVGESQIGLRN